jgi:hypothetical protein
VNDNYIVIHNQDKLFFCNTDLIVIHTKKSESHNFSPICTNNIVCLIPGGAAAYGLLSFTPQEIDSKHLFNDLFVCRAAADIESNLLYFRCCNNDLIIGNEQGEVLSKFQCRLDYFDDIFVSCNIILTSYRYTGVIVVYNQFGQEITQFTDKSILDSLSICLVYDKGIIVILTDDNNINLWRVCK